MNVRTPIRLVLVITELEVGGAERCLTELAVRLPRPQFEPSVISLAPRPRKDDLVQRLEAYRVPVRFLGLNRSLQLPSAIRRLRHSLREVPEAVVQSFLFHANVTTGLSVSDSRRHLLGIRVADPRRWRRVVERRAAKRAAGLVCVSRSVADFCHRQQGIPETRLHVIPNGVALPDEHGNHSESPEVVPPLPFDQSSPFVLFVGRLDAQKGLDWMMPLLPEMLAKFPNHQVVLAGSGPSEKPLRQRVAELGIDRRVHFVGWVADPRSWMRACDVLVLPSRWEGMPNVLLEAMAEQKAVLSTTVEGVSEVLGEQAEAQTVPFGDTDGFNRKLTTLLADSDLRDQLGTLNQQRVAQHFSMDGMVRAYADLFRETAER